MRSTTASIRAGWMRTMFRIPREWIRVACCTAMSRPGLLRSPMERRTRSWFRKTRGAHNYWLNGRLIPDGSIIPGIGETGTTIYTNEGSGWGWADYNSEFYTDGDGSRQHTNWSSNNEIYAFHPGGANHVFADGSVHFVKQSTAPSVFVWLISPAGGEVISSDSY